MSGVTREEGTFREIFSLSGSARFGIGGGQGFQLSDFRVTGFGLLGTNLTLTQPASSLRQPTADLSKPLGGATVSTTILNAAGMNFIEVTFVDINRVGLDLDSIRDDTPEFLLAGSAARNIVINGRPVQVDPNDPTRWRYYYTGTFSMGTDNDPMVEVQFLPGMWTDSRGAGRCSPTPMARPPSAIPRARAS